jgi:hypothetical protein
MCWNGDNRPIVSKKDIPVFKIGLQKKSSKKIYSYFQFMEYELGMTYKSNINIIDYDRWFRPDFISILEGLHSYSMDVDVVKYGGLYIKTVIKRNGNDKLLERYSINKIDEYNLVIMDCIVPKGATYYINEDGEVVSNLIKFVKINQKY